MTEIKGKSAVVTGGGSGIGMGLAKELSRQGAAVAVADIMLDNARKIADEINAEGGRAIAVHCDVSDRASIKAMKVEANAALGHIGLVFANAGATSFEPLVEMSDDDVDWIIQVNLMGAIHTVRAFLPDMIEANEGHIMATSSTAGLFPSLFPVHAPYSASKMGIIGLMMNLANEIAPHNVHTTIYCPGGVASGMKDNNSLYRPAKFGGPTEGGVRVPKVAHASALLAETPITFYSPESIAPIVLNAVRNNRPFAFDHAEQRHFFAQTYGSVVEACFDDIAAYEREHGVPTLADGQPLLGAR